MHSAKQAFSLIKSRYTHSSSLAAPNSPSVPPSCTSVFVRRTITFNFAIIRTRYNGPQPTNHPTNKRNRFRLFGATTLQDGRAWHRRSRKPSRNALAKQNKTKEDPPGRSYPREDDTKWSASQLDVCARRESTKPFRIDFESCNWWGRGILCALFCGEMRRIHYHLG